MIAAPLRTSIRTFDPSPLVSAMAAAFAVILAAFFFCASPAGAVVNSSVRNACMADYFEHCAGMEVGSAELRRCFHKAGPKLQPGCVSALVAAGEVSQATVTRRSGGGQVASKARAGSKKVASAKSKKVRFASTKKSRASKVAIRGSCFGGACKGIALGGPGAKTARIATLR